MESNEIRFVIKPINREIIIRQINSDSGKESDKKIPAWIDVPVLENGFKILDCVRNRLELAFYCSIEQAEKFLNKLNSSRPKDVFNPKKKESNI